MGRARRRGELRNEMDGMRWDGVKQEMKRGWLQWENLEVCKKHL